MKVFKYYAKLYMTFVKNTLSRQSDYRFNFVADLIDSLINFLVSIVFFNSIYMNVNVIEGWGIYETLLLVGTAQLITSFLYILFMNNLPRIQNYILKGDLDYILLKPCDEQFYISLRYFYLGGISNTIPSLILIIYSIINLNISFTFYKLIIYIFYILCGLIISYAIWLIIMTFSIYFIKISELHELFLSTLKFTEYPGQIYKGMLRIIFTFVIPFLAIANVPAGYLIGKVSFTNSKFIFLLAVLFFCVSRIFWKKSLKWYQSASC